jgi:D-3-phosphoglycerate dehydrogenase
MMAKVLVTDSLAPQGLEILERAQGIEVENAPGLDPDVLLEKIQTADALIIRSGTKVTAEVINAGDRLAVVGRAGIGVDNVDVPAASARGVVVMNTPGGNTVTTAEHAIALLVALARHIPQATASMRAGKWEKKKFVGLELYNRTLGVIGLGNIGRIVAQKAKGLGMKIVAYDPFLSDEAAAKLDVEPVDFDTLLARADILTVHVPRTKDTAGLLGRDAFAKTKPGVLLINAARGGIVDEEALFEALESGQVGGAALDVFVEEPPPADHPLLGHPNVICTPHLGASTEQAQVNVAIAVAEQVRDYLLSGVINNAVNVPSISRDIAALIQPYLTLGEKLGRFQGQMCKGQIESIEIEYTGEAAELDVAPITIAVLKGLLTSVSESVNMVNAPIIAQEHGIKVIESKSSQIGNFASAIKTQVKGCDDRKVVGAIFEGGQARIVRLDDFMLEAIPEGPTLLIFNNDEPGVVGAIGMTLGEAGINISRMQLALSPDESEAVMLVNVNPAPNDATVDALRVLSQVKDVHLLELGS